MTHDGSLFCWGGYPRAKRIHTDGTGQDETFPQGRLVIGSCLTMSADGSVVCFVSDHRLYVGTMGSGPAEVVPVRIDPELRAAIEALAEAEHTTTSEIIREAIRRFLEVA